MPDKSDVKIILKVVLDAIVMILESTLFHIFRPDNKNDCLNNLVYGRNERLCMISVRFFSGL